jgi:hypothetical protein
MTGTIQLKQYQQRIPFRNLHELHHALQSFQVQIFDCMVGNCNGQQILCLATAREVRGGSNVPLRNARNNTADLLGLDFLFEQLLESYNEHDLIDTIVSVPTQLNSAYIAISLDDLNILESIQMCEIGRCREERLLPLMHLSISFNTMQADLERLRDAFEESFAYTFSAVPCRNFLQIDIVPNIGDLASYRYQRGLPNDWDNLMSRVEELGLGRRETVALACRASQQPNLQEIKQLIQELDARSVSNIMTLMPIPAEPTAQSFKYASRRVV